MRVLPGMTTDIESLRAKCKACNLNEHRQPKMPPTDLLISTAPFQAIA